MGAPAVGTIVDGYRFNGGDPNSQASWSQVGKAEGVYADTLARERAKSDIKRLEDASEGERNAYGMEATANQAAAILPNTPTGVFADQRIAAGKAVPALGFLPGIPNRTETTNLETMRRLGAMGSLGSVGQLKGPLSEKELAFIQSMQLSPSASRQENARVVEAMKWTARRQAAYGAALRTWTEKLGAPSATNPKGQSFEQWWGKYSSQALPPPGVAPARAAAPPPPRKETPPAAPAGPVRVKSADEAMRLPPGTVFITPDGRRKVR